MTGLPNTFMVFNVYVDRAMELLTDSELRILIFATRHILGWQDKVEDRQGFISISMFEKGYVTGNGVHFAGTGLNRQTIIDAVGGLVDFGFLKKDGKPTSKGQKYTLCTDGIDWSKMESRRDEKVLKAKQRTAKANAKRRGGTSDNTGTLDNTMQGTSDNTMLGTLDNTQTNTYSNPSSNPLADAVAEFIFGIDPTFSTDRGGRIKVITDWLSGKSDGTKDAKVGFISAPAAPEHVKSFAGHWKSISNANMPYDLRKFVDAWRKWASSRKAKVSAPKPANITSVDVELTPAEIEARKQQLAALRKSEVAS